MVFEGKTLETMGEIFNTALDVAKTGNSDRCREFLTSYVEYIVSESNLNVAEAENIAKSGSVCHTHRLPGKRSADRA